jgi:hypothetical protein
MKRISFYILLLATVVLQGCHLESEMYDAINPSIFPKNADDAKALVTGCVYNVFSCDGWSNIFISASTGIQMVNEKASDIGDCSAWADRQHVTYARWTVNNQSYISQQWSWVKSISSMTLNIDRISQIDMDETLKNRYIGEIRCGRGFLAYLLYDYYGPIVIADLETLQNPLDEKILPRLSEEEMQNYIETELTEAAKVLPASYTKGDADYGRFTKGLCNMLLLKFYMLTKQWEKAEVAGRELMKPEYKYELVPVYKDIFTLANEKNAETIWAVNCKTGFVGHMWHAHCVPFDFPTIPASQQKWGGNKIAWSFMHTFEEGDQRLETIYSEYIGTGGIIHNEANDVASREQLVGGAIPYKYEIDPETDGQNNSIDFIIYRYADAITLLSEAIVRKGNTVTSEAVDLLNKVRTRSGLPAYTLSSFGSSRDFLDKLLMERAHELYFEGHRRTDLIRDGSWVEAMKKKCQAVGELTLVNDNYVRYPLPQSVIDEGKGVIVQNPGY